MIKWLQLAWIFFLISKTVCGQIKSGPMLGAIELRTAYVWCEVHPGTDIQLEYWKKGERSRTQTLKPDMEDRFEFHVRSFYLTGLEPGTTYEYQLLVNRKHKTAASGSLTTQELWKFRKPAPDFRFLAGSCAYFNEPAYDRPGRAYGGDSSIFQTMAAEPAAFMLWLGDNWYNREVDFDSEWGIWYRPSRDRSQAVLQKFWKAMPHYAIWDDHDFGPNNEGLAYIFKNEAKRVFSAYWCNPGKSIQNPGIYTKFSYSDADFFLMDDRTFRSSDNMNDSLDRKDHPEKQMWGPEQMNWLKNQLLNSRATFKFIANGTTILNAYNSFDCMYRYKKEYHALLDFIREERISGVVFLTGDRHHSEVIGKKIGDSCTLFDITSSSLTAGAHKVTGLEINHPDRIPGTLVEVNNYTRFHISGVAKDRMLQVEFMSPKGEKLGGFSLHENQIKWTK